MNLIFKEKLNEIITNRVYLGEIVYTENRISDNNIENGLYDVYERPSVYKERAWHEIESDCKTVHGYGLHVTSYNVHFFSTAFNVKLDGILYKIVDTPSKRIAYTNDSRFDFSSIKVRVYGCRDKLTRDSIRNIVKPYIKKMGVKKARIDYLNWEEYQGYELLINGFEMNEKKIDKINQEYYKTNINL